MASSLPTPAPTPSPLPSPVPRPVRKLSNAAATAISAGESAFHTLASQVGGHPGVLASEDNLLIVKACLPHERAFYELLAQEEPSVARLQPFVPRFYGTLKLEGHVAVEKGLENAGGVAGVSAEVGLEHLGIVPIAPSQEKDEYFLCYFHCTSGLSGPVVTTVQSIVLENVSAIFTKPNIMDVKLGTVLYEEEAPPEKKERMIEMARTTTSLETGVRLTGFQVYDHTAGESVITPKSYGKSITVSDLPDGIRRFFPVSDSASDSTTPVGLGLPRELLLPIVRGLLADIRGIRDALAATELRMVGGSLLIVYEADWDAARIALHAQAATQESLAAGSSEVTNSAGTDADDGYDSDIESEEEEVPAYVVRLIDFAHTRLTPGEGPDEGVLKGIDTTISLFEGRIKELE